MKDEPVEVPPRPPQVTRAIRLLWLTLAVGMVSLLPAIRGEWWVDPEGGAPPQGALAFVFVLIVIFTAIWVALVLLTGRRRNWARWVLLVYLAFGWIMQLPELSTTIAETPFAGAMDVLCHAAEMVAAYLLFLSPGAAWYKRQPAD